MSTDNYSLKTERLQLDLLKESDAEELWPYVSNPEVSRQMSWEAHTDIQTTIDFLSNVQEGFKQGRAVSWGIRLDGKLIGVFSVISIHRIHRSLVYDKAELAYWLGPEFQKRGIMTEAGRKILEFAFNGMKLHKIYVGFHLGNEGSKGLIERLKFRFSHLEREAFKKDGEWIDVHYYEMLEKEYHELYK
jgi:[ribosomal protein S5]-alanine N-acetyltransferase